MAAVATRTADLVIEDGQGRILMVERGHGPYKGRLALPGGHVEGRETHRAAALRELTEETGLKLKPRQLKLTGVYDKPGHTPSGPTSNKTYYAKLKAAAPVAGSDAASLRWVADWKNERLAFDHKQVLEDTMAKKATKKATGKSRAPNKGAGANPKSALAARRRAANNAIAADMGRGGGQKLLGFGPTASKSGVHKSYADYRAAKGDPVGGSAKRFETSRPAARVPHDVSSHLRVLDAITRTDKLSPSMQGAVLQRYATKPPASPMARPLAGPSSFSGPSFSRAYPAASYADWSRNHDPKPFAQKGFAINAGVTLLGSGVAAGKAYRETGSVKEAAKAAAPGLGLLTAGPAGHVLSHMGDKALSVAGALWDSVSFDRALLSTGAAALDMPGLAVVVAPEIAGGAIVGGAGVALKLAGGALKVASKVAAPAMAAYGAYKGAQGDRNKVRGAVRGVVSTFDMSSIWKDKGYGERAVDKVAGKPDVRRFAPGDAQSYAAANERFTAMRQAAQTTNPTGKKRGYSNAARIGAAKARGVQNLPYGGDPNAGPEAWR